MINVTEYKDTAIALSIAFVLLIVLAITSIPPVVTVVADNSYLSTSATIEITVDNIIP